MFPSSLKELTSWVTFLLPGWLALCIVGVVADISATSDIYIVFSAFLLSTLSLLTVRACRRVGAWMRQGPKPQDDEAQPSSPGMFAAAAVFGLIIGLGLQHNL